MAASFAFQKCHKLSSDHAFKHFDSTDRLEIETFLVDDWSDQLTLELGEKNAGNKTEQFRDEV